MVNLSLSNKWWKPIEEAFAGTDLKGLKINCPQCKEKGIVTTRWIKGPALKPIYILHIKWEKVKKKFPKSEKFYFYKNVLESFSEIESFRFGKKV